MLLQQNGTYSKTCSRDPMTTTLRKFHKVFHRARNTQETTDVV